MKTKKVYHAEVHMDAWFDLNVEVFGSDLDGRPASERAYIGHLGLSEETLNANLRRRLSDMVAGGWTMADPDVIPDIAEERVSDLKQMVGETKVARTGSRVEDDRVSAQKFMEKFGLCDLPKVSCDDYIFLVPSRFEQVRLQKIGLRSALRSQLPATPPARVAIYLFDGDGLPESLSPIYETIVFHPLLTMFGDHDDPFETQLRRDAHRLVMKAAGYDTLAWEHEYECECDS